MDRRFHNVEIYTANNKQIRMTLNQNTFSKDLAHTNEAKEVLLAEGGENIYNYIEWLGLVNEPDLIVLSSQHHYYYTEEELKRTKTIVNLKPLNQIKNLKIMVHSIFNLMPQNSNFIACFADNNSHLEDININNSFPNDNISNFDAFENGIVSRIPFINKIYNFIDNKTNRQMSRREVINLFKLNGFKILDMTKHIELTYLCVQKLYIADN